MNKEELSRQVWGNATALLDDEVSEKIIVNIEAAGKDFLDQLSQGELAGVLHEVPGVYEYGAGYDWVEFINSSEAIKGLGEHGVAVEVYDLQGIHYAIQPGGRVVMADELGPSDLPESEIEL